jgi:peptide/nickel transport system permease protein
LLGYLARRVLLLGLMLFGLLCITFVISHVAPGDPARLAAGPTRHRRWSRRSASHYRLDRPLHIQFGQYLRGVLGGDLGRS